DVHRARLADPPEVVALEVDEHDVLGALLWMRHQRRGLARILARLPAARPGAGNGASLDAPAGDARQALGRGAEQRRAAPLCQRRKRGRIDGAQALVQPADIRLAPQLHSPGARQVGLIDVAGPDVFLAAPHPLEVRARLLLDDAGHRKGLRRPCGSRACTRQVTGVALDVSEGRCSGRLGDRLDLARAPVMNERAGNPQRKSLPGVRGAWRRQNEPRLDFRGELVADEDRPAAAERQVGRIVHRVAHTALYGDPPVERPQKPLSGYDDTAWNRAFRPDAPVRIDPERGRRIRNQHALAAERPIGRAVEKNGIALRTARRKLPQDGGRNIQLAEDQVVPPVRKQTIERPRAVPPGPRGRTESHGWPPAAPQATSGQWTNR